MHGPNPTSIDAIPAFEFGNGRHLLQQEFASCPLDHGKIGKPHVNAGFGNEPDATSISDPGLFRLLTGNLSAGALRLLQQNLPQPDSCTAAKRISYSITS